MLVPSKPTPKSSKYELSVTYEALTSARVRGSK